MIAPISNSVTNLDGRATFQKWINNPSPKVYKAIPQVERRHQVAIRKIWCESYDNAALLIKGRNANVTNAYKELLEVQKSAQ